MVFADRILVKLLRALKKANLLIAWSVYRFIPKKQSRIVFGAMNGRWYADNSRHLFEWYLRRKPEIDAVWLTASERVFRNLRSEGLPAARMWSWHGVRLLHTASAGYFTHSFRDLAAFQWLMPESLRLIALRHGRSVKRIRFARKNHKLSEAEAKEREKEGRLIHVAISTSSFISNIQEECLRIGLDKHMVTGYPRNDCLIDICASQKKSWSEFLTRSNPDMVILYGPSWRHGREPTRFFPFDDFDSIRLFEVLDKHHILLLLRPHKNDLENPEVKRFLLSLASENKLVRLCTHDHFPDVNTFLPFVDMLISDFSALYHDYLLLDRPMLFIPYDYDIFEKENGFLYDYFENLPGPAINSFEAFIEHIVSAANGKDEYQKQRSTMIAKVHEHQDANSCERVAQLLDNL